MKIEMLGRDSNCFRYVVDRHGKILRKTYMGSCCAADLEPSSVRTYSRDYGIDRIFQDVVGIEYSRADIEELENKKAKWVFEPVKVKFDNGEIIEFKQAVGWGSQIKNGVGLGITKKFVEKYVNRLVGFDERRYMVERAFFSNNLASIRVKGMKVKKVKGGTPMWSDEFLVAYGKQHGFSKKQVLWELTHLGRPCIWDGWQAMPYRHAKYLADEEVIRTEKRMRRPPSVVHMRKWKSNPMAWQWIPKKFIPVVLSERLPDIVRSLSALCGKTEKGKSTFVDYAVQANPGFGEGQIGRRLLEAEIEMEHHPFICAKLMDPKSDFIFNSLTTGNPDVEGIVLAPLTNPEKEIPLTAALNVDDDWKDNMKRIGLPSHEEHRRFEDVLDNGDNAITRYPIDSATASQVGFTWTSGFLSFLFSTIRSFQNQYTGFDGRGKMLFSKGMCMVIPDELWPDKSVDSLTDAEDWKMKEDYVTQEEYDKFKKDFRTFTFRGYVGSKQIFGAGSMAWCNITLLKGFYADCDGDQAFIESGAQVKFDESPENPVRYRKDKYHQTVKIKKMMLDFYDDFLQNPKLPKTYTSGHAVGRMVSSLGGHAVVGVWTNVSLLLLHDEEHWDEIALEADADSLYEHVCLSFGYFDYQPELPSIKKLFYVIAAGIKVGTDCFKTDVNLKWWRRKGWAVNDAINEVGTRARWLLDYNPSKETSVFFACRTTDGLPLRVHKDRIPKTLPDYIAKMMLVTGVIYKGEYLCDADGNRIVLRLDDPLLDMWPLSVYKRWALRPPSELAKMVVERLFQLYIALIDEYDFSSPESFIRFWEEIWGDIIDMALEGKIPRDVKKVYDDGKWTFKVGPLRHYGKPFTAWELANWMWYRFSEMRKHTWRTCAGVMWAFQDECVRIAKEKPGLSQNALTSTEEGFVLQEGYKCAIAGKGNKFLGVPLNKDVDVFVSIKRKLEPLYRYNNRGEVITAGGKKLIDGYYGVRRVCISPYEVGVNCIGMENWPEPYCLVDQNSDWILDQYTGLPASGRYIARFNNEGSRQFVVMKPYVV